MNGRQKFWLIIKKMKMNIKPFIVDHVLHFNFVTYITLISFSQFLIYFCFIIVMIFFPWFILQMHWFNGFQFNGYWMYHQNGLKTYENHNIQVFSMIFVLHVMHIIMVKAVQISVDHVTINSVIIHAHQRAILFAYLAGKETIAPKVNHPFYFLFSLLCGWFFFCLHFILLKDKIE